MTIEQLQKMASGLYKSSGDALPESARNSRESWFAHKIEEAIQQKGPLLNKLLASQNKEEVYDLLGGTYRDVTYGEGDDHFREDYED